MSFSYCYGCEFENRPTAVFCGKCGLPLALTCLVCQSVNPGANRFCDSCGTSIGEESQSTFGMEDQNSRATPLSRSSSTDGRRLLKPKLIGLDQLIGLRWETLAPHWQWSRTYFFSWVLRNRMELLAVVFLTALAAFLRVYRLGDIPHGFHGDEAWNGLDATRILEEGWIGVYTPGALGNMAGAIYLTALTTWLFDASIFSVRLSMALFGIATIPATHLLLRLGFGRWVALIGTFALAVSYLHLHFSRIGLQLVSLPFVAVLASVALLWAMRSQHRWIWLAAGAALGLVPYTYLAFPAFFASALVTLAVFLFLRRDELAHLLVLLGWLAFGFLIIASPFLFFLLDNWVVYMERMGLASVLRSHEFPQGGSFTENMAFLIKRAWDASTSFVRNPRYDGVDGTGGVGAVDIGLGALFYIGLAVSIRKWRSPPHLLTVMVVLSAIATQVFSDPSSGMMRRSLAAIPFVVGAAGIGATSAIGVAKRQFGKSRPPRRGRGTRVSLASRRLLEPAVLLWRTDPYRKLQVYIRPRSHRRPCRCPLLRRPGDDIFLFRKVEFQLRKHPLPLSGK